MDQFVLNTLTKTQELREQYANLHRKVWGVYPPSMVSEDEWLINHIEGVKEYLREMELNRWDVL